MDALAAMVVAGGYDIGIAFDGDADRCLAVDENGELLTGDHIIFIMARRLKDKGALAGNTAVSTIMSNIGLYRALEKEGISSLQTTVGDRFIFEAMQKHGYQVGGEQSGHIILKKYGTAGDGILTAIKLVEEMLDRKASLSKLASPVVLFPQHQESVRVKSKEAAAEDAAVRRRIEEIGEELRDSGRILLRKSGTEPVIRIMVEAETEECCKKYVAEMIALIRSRGLCE